MALMRRTRYNIPKLFWRCPHCGFEHGAADLLRTCCKGCGHEFPGVKGEERE
jgi:rubredoxin